MKPSAKKPSPQLSSPEGAQRVYTKTGDDGSTGLFGGGRVAKNHPRLMAYGALDELNAVIGLLEAQLSIQGDAQILLVRQQLKLIQSTLSVLGSHLATEDSSPSARALLPQIDLSFAKTLEGWMDEMSKELAPLKNFILPGGTVAASSAHIARTATRRAEREAVHLLQTEPQLNAVNAANAGSHWFAEVLKGLNRLNDYFFVLARHLNRIENKDEELWIPNPKK